MTPALRPLLGLLLVAAAGLACAADGSIGNETAVDQTGNDAGSFAAQYLSHGIHQDKGKAAVLATVDLSQPSGWTAGSTSARAEGRTIDNGLVALRGWGGYAGKVGELAYDAVYNYYSYPGARRAATGVAYDYGELAAGLRYRALNASYHYATTRDFFGVPDARGSAYLDLAMQRSLGPDTSLSMHAGDGHVAGGGNAAWDWRDLKAGLARKLDGGWNVAVNYTKALGAAAPADRSTMPDTRPDGRPAYLNAGHRALVLSMARSF